MKKYVHHEEMDNFCQSTKLGKRHSRSTDLSLSYIYIFKRSVFFSLWMFFMNFGVVGVTETKLKM